MLFLKSRGNSVNTPGINTTGHQLPEIDGTRGGIEVKIRSEAIA